jgi:hypothetical protein
MTQRTITIEDCLIHEEINKLGRLELSICLWNDGTEIPGDWHDIHADFMELQLTFSIQKIVDDLIEMHSTWDQKDEIIFDMEDQKLVDLYKKEFQKSIDRLNKIKFLSDEEINARGDEEVEITIEVDDEADK